MEKYLSGGNHVLGVKHRSKDVASLGLTGVRSRFLQMVRPRLPVALSMFLRVQEEFVG